jgi:hypothetical protein
MVSDLWSNVSGLVFMVEGFGVLEFTVHGLRFLVLRMQVYR